MEAQLNESISLIDHAANRRTLSSKDLFCNPRFIFKMAPIQNFAESRRSYQARIAIICSKSFVYVATMHTLSEETWLCYTSLPTRHLVVSSDFQL